MSRTAVGSIAPFACGAMIVGLVAMGVSALPESPVTSVPSSTLGPTIVVPNEYPTLEAAIRCAQLGETIEWRDAYFVTTIRVESRTPCDGSD